MASEELNAFLEFLGSQTKEQIDGSENPETHMFLEAMKAWLEAFDSQGHNPWIKTSYEAGLTWSELRSLIEASLIYE